MHIRSNFDHEIQGIQDDLLLMGSMVEKQIGRAMTALKDLDYDLARRVVHYACREHVLPKHLEAGLVMLRDPRLREHGATVVTADFAG